MTIIKNFQLLADFNAWANTKIFASCKKLDESEYKKDRKAFFTSILGTLNHLLVIDKAYISRIEGTDHGMKSMNQIFLDVLFWIRILDQNAPTHHQNLLLCVYQYFYFFKVKTITSIQAGLPSCIG